VKVESFNSLAMQAGHVLQRPYIPLLKEDNIRKGFFEREQFDAVRRHLRAPLDHAVTLAYYIGWRMASEILTLQWHQVDRTEALTAKGIIAPHLFCRGGGQPIKSFYTRWDQACTAAGCPGRIPHDMRRTAVRNLNRAGVPETVAMKITGHKTRSVFDRYDITSEEDLAEAARKL
jgi:integrase